MPEEITREMILLQLRGLAEQVVITRELIAKHEADIDTIAAEGEHRDGISHLRTSIAINTENATELGWQMAVALNGLLDLYNALPPDGS